MQIIPRQGLSDVRFGMRPRDVLDRLGPQVGWQPWMGGNLNGALRYPDTLLHFDRCSADGPKEDAGLESIEIRTGADRIELLGRPPAQWTRGALATRLGEDGALVTQRGDDLLVPDWHLELSFAADGHVDAVGLAAPWIVVRSDPVRTECPRCGPTTAAVACRELDLDGAETRHLLAWLERTGLARRLAVEPLPRGVRVWDLARLGQRGRWPPGAVRRGRAVLRRERNRLAHRWLCTGCGALVDPCA
ncbi:MAG: hypothetical protein IPM29_23445 [Planctomycetes bacterium]|nr:hypothetical protein [Planctomycetota bacterium]